MTEFFSALASYSFLQYAVAAGLLASVACGVVGSYVVARRITYLAGAVAHSVLGGMGAARYLQVVHGVSWLTPLLGAVAAAVLAALVMGLVSLHAREREDTVIGAIWAVGMAVGILFIAATPGYSADLMGYLFGNILMVTPEDLWLMAGLDLVVVGLGLLFYKQLLAVCFDEEFAATRGLAVGFYYLLLLMLTALTVVLLVSVVGIVLVIALLTLPAAIAGHLARSLGMIMVLAVGICGLLTFGGLALSYSPDLPAGATIVALCGGAYLAVALATAVIRQRRSTTD